MNKGILVFDIDGVILESLQAKTKAFEELYFNYGKKVTKNIISHHKKNGGISRFEKIKFYNKEFLKIDDKKTDEKFIKNFSSITKEIIINCDFVNGFLTFLSKIENNYDLYISTGTPTNEAKLILQKKKIIKKFKIIYGSPESKISHLKNILSFYSKINYDSLFFFGDSIIDYEAAIKFKFNFLLRFHNENKFLINNKNIFYKFKDFNDPSLLDLFDTKYKK